MKNKTLISFPKKINVHEFIEKMLPYPKIEILTYDRVNELFSDIEPTVSKYDYEKQRTIDLINICYVQVGDLLWVDNEDKLFTIDIDNIKESYTKLDEIKKYKIYLTGNPEENKRINMYKRIFFSEKLKNKYNLK